MSHTLTLDLSEEVYSVLFRTAKQTEQLPETLAAKWLTIVTQHMTDDPVEQFIGAFKSDIPDWADKHDAYLGKAIAEEISQPQQQGDAS